ncbi:MAG: DNA polymerase III subunit delta [Nitrospiraceae bacterium]
MKVSELASFLKAKGPSSLFLIVGEEDYLRDQSLAMIKSLVLGEDATGGFNYDLFYGGDCEVNEVLTCAVEVPVFASQRLVVVKSADKIPAHDAEKILPYLQSSCDTTCLIFMAAKLDKRLKFTQALAQRAATVECHPLNDGQLAAWVRTEGTRLGLRLHEDSIALLKEAAGGGLYAVRRELEKLASYIPQGATVRTQDVEMLRGTEPGASVFDLTEAIGAQDRGRALRILARNLEAGEAPLRMLGSLVWQYRRLWKAQDFHRQGGRDTEAARTLRMEPYRVRTFLGQFPDAHLKHAFHLFLETDSKLKGGSGGSGIRILEELTLNLCASAGSSSSPQAPKPGPARSITNVRTIKPGKSSAN